MYREKVYIILFRSYLLTILAPYRHIKYKEEDKAATFTLEISWSSNKSQSKNNPFFFLPHLINRLKDVRIGHLWKCCWPSWS